MSALHAYRLPLALALAAIYNLFFWQEKLGINLPLFSVLLMGLVLLLNKETLKRPNVWITAVGTLLTGFLVLWINSGTAKVIHICSTLLFVGFVHQPSVRTVFHALGQVFDNYLHIGSSILEEWLRVKDAMPGFKRLSAYLKLIFVPILVVLVFFFLFKFANPRFSEMTSSFFEWMGEWFVDISIFRILFILSGFAIALGLLFNRFSTSIRTHDAQQSDTLQRIRRKVHGTFNFLGLKKEYRIGLMLVGMVNLLLLFNNVIDIDWIWFGFEVEEGMSLRQFVHEGTWFLILSILLSIAIMLHFFRNNQHFYKPQGPLHTLSYLWIVQNIILVISVAMRNIHYINHHGLAYKRIGVFFFLMLTLFGLITLFLKIRQNRSAFYLFRTNGWAVYGVAILLSLANWDAVISRYNLTQSYSGGLDTSFLLSMSDKTLPLLLDLYPEAEAKLRRLGEVEQNDSKYLGQLEAYRVGLEEKVLLFKEKQEELSWLSWNRADAEALDYVGRYDEETISLVFSHE